ncbi:MAG TPA: biopolymer transporter ExbD [Pirellulaceae bacterium]|nr:biopolymer transporter ExbD [Pirellulaceae bacterium]
MKFKSRSGGGSVEIDMTPMIDICFQLLTFFCFILNFSGAEQDERVQLPASTLAKPPEKAAETPITLQVTREGRVIAVGQTLPTPSDVLPLLNLERTLLEQKGQSPADATIIIRGHRDAKTGVIQELIKVCQTAGFEKFTLRAKEEQS